MHQDSTIQDVKRNWKFGQNRKSVVPIDLNWRKKYYQKVYKKRAIAFILDFFSTSILAFIPAIIFFPVVDEKSFTSFFLSQIIFFIALCAIMESSKWQASIGKRIMRIQITGEDGNSVTFFRSLWRNFLKIIFGYSCILIFPLLIQIHRFTRTKRLIHDELSDTIIGERLTR